MNGPGPGIAADNVDHREMERRSEDRKSVVVMDPRLDPSRWWFASSAFPMIAGTLGPVASAFSICALVRPWRQHASPKGSTIQTGDFVLDPTWLIAVNAIQLAVALTSNMFLLLNMARRVRFSIAQPISIVGWYMSSICLTVLLSTGAGPLVIEPDDEYIWSQAFFYGVWAAILYFVVASLMVTTALGAHRGHYSRDFQLTNSQRTLMLQTIMYLMYMLVGALVFSRLEGWTYLDAVYWANVTLFTIGFGDLIVTSPVGRGLLIPYALVGIVSVGLVIGSIRSLVLQRAGRRIDVRMVEKKRRVVIRDMARRGNDSVLRPIRAEPDPDAGFRSAASRTLSLQEARRAEFERRETEFNLMRAIQHEGIVRRRWVATAVSTGPWLLLWLGGAAAFVEFERPYQAWTYFDGVYFTFVSLTTLGYGDVTPQSNGGRSFFVFWSLLALPTMTVLISNAGDTVVKLIRDATLALGNITILPGEKGFKRDMRYAAHKVSLGLLFRDTFAAEKQRGDTDDTLRALHTHVEEARPKSAAGLEKSAIDEASPPADQGESGPSPKNKREDEAEEEEGGSSESSPAAAAEIPDISDMSTAEYHYVLISAISTVTNDLKADPPKKYTFAEWAFYLTLVGEDESSADTHRTAVPLLRRRRPRRAAIDGRGRLGDPEPDHPVDGSRRPLKGRRSRRRRAAAGRMGAGLRRGRSYLEYFEDEKQEEEKAGRDKWSWVGDYSPLMGGVAEAEWILERLTVRLKEELEGVWKEGQGSESGGSGEGDGASSGNGAVGGDREKEE